ncbi:MAG: hypothetical protein J7605_02740 [Variovorax sp.]|nr:hypothetical protein [Variovorax sp.]
MFQRDRLPDPLTYYQSQGLHLQGRGRWRTAGCPFHGSSDSLRVNVETGAFVCMAACGARGGDVIAFEMAMQGCSFVAAAKALGCWVDHPSDAAGKERRRPLPFPPREALEVLAEDAMLITLCGLHAHHGDELTDDDRAAWLEAHGRVQFIISEVLK